MTNGTKNVKGIFVVDNKEATVSAINNIKNHVETNTRFKGRKNK